MTGCLKSSFFCYMFQNISTFKAAVIICFSVINYLKIKSHLKGEGLEKAGNAKWEEVEGEGEISSRSHCL